MFFMSCDEAACIYLVDDIMHSLQNGGGAFGDIITVQLNCRGSQ